MKMKEYSEQVEASALQTEDIFQEIGNIGTGSSMASLAHMAGKEVCYSSPAVIEAEYGRVTDWLGLEDENVAGVLIPFAGDMTGMILQIYRRNSVGAILNGLLEQDMGGEELDGRLLDLLREVANIMASSYLAALSSYSQCRINVLDSAISMDMAGAILTEVIGAAGSQGTMLCIGNRFHLKGEDGESCMLTVLPESAVEYFMKALGVEG